MTKLPVAKLMTQYRQDLRVVASLFLVLQIRLRATLLNCAYTSLKKSYFKKVFLLEQDTKKATQYQQMSVVIKLTRVSGFAAIWLFSEEKTSF